MESTQERVKETRWVRREAQPHTWGELTAQQRQVIEQINDWLREYVSLPVPAEGKGKSLLQRALVDEHRYSNVVLIDGGRGSGKTSVMMTLLALW